VAVIVAIVNEGYDSLNNIVVVPYLHALRVTSMKLYIQRDGILRSVSYSILCCPPSATKDVICHANVHMLLHYLRRLRTAINSKIILVLF